jgi:putative transposase
VYNFPKCHIWLLLFPESIADASWTMFRTWVEYLGKVFGTVTVAVPPHYTSQNCFSCGTTVEKILSTRTHKCKCGTVLDRDENGARNILKLGLRTVRRAYGNIPV